MGLLRKLIFLNWWNGRGPRGPRKWFVWQGNKCRAKRNENGEPICGGCQSVVPENAKRCAACGTKLYTFRGTGARRLSFLFGFTFIVQALMGPGGSVGIGLLPSLVIGPIGLILLFLSIQWFRKRPVRELNIRDQFPI